jgi:NAD(P)-dependent dehydrogenase (short-subunit alcohol dehydrogenase family)
LKVKDFEKDMQINVYGAIKTIKALLPKLNKNDSSIVMFSTVAVQQGMPFHASVAAAKGAVEGLTRSLAAEFAPGIRVNCIAPSLTDTPMAARLLGNDARREASEQRHPLKRIGSPADIAGMATVLLSPESSWMSGQIIGIDGGMSALRV